MTRNIQLIVICKGICWYLVGWTQAGVAWMDRQGELCKTLPENSAENVVFPQSFPLKNYVEITTWKCSLQSSAGFYRDIYVHALSLRTSGTWAWVPCTVQDMSRNFLRMYCEVNCRDHPKSFKTLALPMVWLRFHKGFGHSGVTRKLQNP